LLRKYTNYETDIFKIFVILKYFKFERLHETIKTINNQHMKDFFYAIQDLFVNGLFLPLDHLRKLELINWFAANSISWIFLIIGFVAMVYWMGQLKTFNDNNEEDKSVTAHSYL
jgi:Family of unknown function (DUF6341)